MHSVFLSFQIYKPAFYRILFLVFGLQIFILIKMKITDLTASDGLWMNIKAKCNNSISTDKGITAYSLHPGVVATELNRNLWFTKPIVGWLINVIAWPFFKEPRNGAQTTICCAVDETLASETGKYYRQASFYNIWLLFVRFGVPHETENSGSISCRNACLIRLFLAILCGYARVLITFFKQFSNFLLNDRRHLIKYEKCLL